VEGLSKHHEPDDQVRRIGEYQALVETMTTAQHVVDQFLWRAFKPGMNARQLIYLYQTQRKFSFIFRNDDKPLNVRGFNHTEYAVTCAADMCGSKK